MRLLCPACRAAIALEDVNPSTDVALCRRCQATHSFAALNQAQTHAQTQAQNVDIPAPPPGARFENLPGGFLAEASTRSWSALFLVPFTLLWSGASLGGIYGRPIARGTLHPANALFGLPFLLGSLFLICWCAMLTLGVVRVTRQGDDLRVFTGVGPLGWSRGLRCSDFRTVREDFVAGMGRSQGRAIILEGNTRVAFGSLLSEPRRYFLLQVLRRMLAGR